MKVFIALVLSLMASAIDFHYMSDALDHNPSLLLLAIIFSTPIVSVFMIWFLPWLIAWERHHNHERAIFWLTFLLGGTGIGWIVAFIWALMDDGRVNIHLERETRF